MYTMKIERWTGKAWARTAMHRTHAAALATLAIRKATGGKYRMVTLVDQTIDGRTYLAGEAVPEAE